MGGGGRRASPTRVWECLAAVASGDLRGLLESEAAAAAGGSAAGASLLEMAGSGPGGAGRPAVEIRGGTGGEVTAGLSCQRLLVEAAAFERFGYSDMAAACARSVLQVRGVFRLCAVWFVRRWRGGAREQILLQTRSGKCGGSEEGDRASWWGIGMRVNMPWLSD